jgi:hypothetical protein
MTLPEAVAVIRSILLVQPARGARVTRVTVVLSDGRIVSFHEVEGIGACEGRAEAFALARAVRTPTPPQSIRKFFDHVAERLEALAGAGYVDGAG